MKNFSEKKLNYSDDRRDFMEWINVKDRLPDQQVIYVLVSMASGLVMSTLYCADKHFFNPSCGEKLIGDTDEVSAHFQHAREYGYKVTHWMPLPKPPPPIDL